MKKIIIFITLLFLFSGSYSQLNIKAEIPKSRSLLSFKENKGQVSNQFLKASPDILFTGNAGDFIFHLKNKGISYQLCKVDKWKQTKGDSIFKYVNSIHTNKTPEQSTIYRVDINWLNTNPKALVIKENPIEGYDNYYSEICPNGITGVKSYKNVTYQNLYNGIDLKWYEKDGKLKYDYVLAAGIDHKQIQLEIKGAETISVNRSGELIIKTPLGEITEAAPYATQKGKQLAAKWIVEKNLVSFEIKNIDPSVPLTIDPLIRFWGTYYGGSVGDDFYASVADVFGNVYASGDSYSLNNIATTGAHQTVLGDVPSSGLGDAVLVKFNSAGARLWATYYGGTGIDYAYTCSVDAGGNYVGMVGTTTSTLAGVIASLGSHQTTYGGQNANHPAGTPQFKGDAFVVLFNNAGTRLWGTYYGGAGDEEGNGCNIDINGNIFLAGITTSTNGVSIATPGSHQPLSGGDYDGFLVKFNNAGTRLWGTYYGGKSFDFVQTCTSDAAGNVYVAGTTTSTNNISTPGTHQPILCGPYNNQDGLIIKFNSLGVRQWGTYYGDAGNEWTRNCVIDPNGNIYVAGTTSPRGDLNPSLISTLGSHQPLYGGSSYESFLLKLTSTGTRDWCTFYGGKGNENDAWCSMDPAGNIYLIGSTTSTNAISTPCSWQPNYAGGGGDAYMAKFTPTGTRLWGTYYGGTGSELYCTSAADLSGNIYIVGSTKTATGTAIASPGSYQQSYSGGFTNGFLAKFDGCIPNAINVTDPSSLTICQGDSTVLTTLASCGITWFDAPVGGSIVANTPAFTTPNLTTTTTFYASESSCGSTSSLTAITVTVNQTPTVSVNLPNVMLCYKSKINLTAAGATSYTWSPETSLSCILCSSPVASPNQTIEYCVVGTNDNVCFAKACSTVEVNLANSLEFSFPTAFTPNGDGNNDSFCLQGWNYCNDNFHIMIFDRWGEKVFESTDPNFCWDGFYKGKLLTADVFVYSVNAEYKDDTKVNKKGNITLIR